MSSDDDGLFIKGPGLRGAKSIFLMEEDEDAADNSDASEDEPSPRTNRKREVEWQKRMHMRSKRSRAATEEAEEQLADSVFVRNERKNGARAEQDVPGAWEAPHDDHPHLAHSATQAVERHSAMMQYTMDRARRTLGMSEGVTRDVDEAAIAREADMEEQRRKVALLREEAPRGGASSRSAAPAAPQPGPASSQSQPAAALARPVDGAAVEAVVVGVSIPSLGKQLEVKLKSVDGLGKIRKRVCPKFGVASENAVLFFEGHPIPDSESTASLGIPPGSSVEVAVSDRPAVSLRVRLRDEIVLPDVRVRQEDPIVSVIWCLCRKAGLLESQVALELDGDTVGAKETSEMLDVESGTLLDVRLK